MNERQEPGTGLPEEPPALPGTPPARYDLEHNLTGDWGGMRTWLSDRGVELAGGYAMEFVANPVGGRSQGQAYVHNVLLQLDLDLERLVGLPDSAFRVRFSQRSGRSLTLDHIGNSFSVQQLYGGQTYRLAKLLLDPARLDFTDCFLDEASPLGKHLSPDAFVAIAEHLDVGRRQLFEFSYLTGKRKGQMSRTTWAHYTIARPPGSSPGAPPR